MRYLIGIMLSLLMLSTAQGAYAATPTPSEQIAALEEELAELTEAYDRKVNEAKVLRGQRNDARREVEELNATIDSLYATIEAMELSVEPTPTAVPENGCATTAERQYFDDATLIVSDFYQNYQALVAELESSSPDLNTISTLMGRFPGHYQRYLALDVPSDRLQSVHDHGLATLYHMNQASTYYDRWLTTFADDDLQQTVNEILAAGTEADKAAAAISAIQSELCL